MGHQKDVFDMYAEQHNKMLQTGH
ncbi:hypothetical protein D043_0673A, partial [Vibrio parahaemolyticus EKP-021]